MNTKQETVQMNFKSPEPEEEEGSGCKTCEVWQEEEGRACYEATPRRGLGLQHKSRGDHYSYPTRGVKCSGGECPSSMRLLQPNWNLWENPRRVNGRPLDSGPSQAHGKCSEQQTHTHSKRFHIYFGFDIRVRHKARQC